MKSFLTWVLYLAIGAGVLAGICYMRGMYLPLEHETYRSVTIAAPRAEVFKAILDYQSLPQWYRGVTAVEPLPSENGDQCYSEIHGNDRARVCEHIVAQGKNLIDRIKEKDFQGTWTYELEAINANTTHLTTTERGKISSPWARFTTYFFGLGSEVNKFHEDLKKHVEK